MKWLRILKRQATGLDASLSFFDFSQVFTDKTKTTPRPSPCFTSLSTFLPRRQDGVLAGGGGGGGAGSEAWNRAYMIAPVKEFGRVGLCTNFIPNKHGGGEEGEVAELPLFGVRAFVLVQHYFGYSKFKHLREGFNRFCYLFL